MFSPQRLERQRQARLDSPPQVAPPGEGSLMAEPGSDLITAFRVEDWRLPEEGAPTSADVYLSAYMIVREAEGAMEAGDQGKAREKYERAAKAFERISESDATFEPAMVEYRRNKIARALRT